jgi:GNAT superfamily N-acetyltransferase
LAAQEALRPLPPIVYFSIMDEIIIAAFERGEEFPIFKLIKTVFDEFVAPDYSPAGNAFFYAYIDPAKLTQRISEGNIVLTAKAAGAIVGAIEVREANHICLLFVDKARQGQGIAKKLVERAGAICREKDTALRCFEVNASPYSEKIYAKMGFRKTANMQNVNGLKFVPMMMEFAS